MYQHNAAYARQNGQLEEYRETYWKCVEATRGIEDIISDSFDGMHLGRMCLRNSIDKYGEDLVRSIIVCTILSCDWDGRISRSNKEWAKTVKLPDLMSDRIGQFRLRTHPTVFNGFVDLYRK